MCFKLAPRKKWIILSQMTMFSTCNGLYGRHMPFIKESTNQYHATLMRRLLSGSTLYLYFSANYSISNNKRLHLEHTLPETSATTASFGCSRHDDIPVIIIWGNAMQVGAVKRWWPPNGWLAVKKRVVFSEHTHLSMKVIFFFSFFTQRFSESWMAAGYLRCYWWNN